MKVFNAVPYYRRTISRRSDGSPFLIRVYFNNFKGVHIGHADMTASLAFSYPPGKPATVDLDA